MRFAIGLALFTMSFCSTAPAWAQAAGKNTTTVDAPQTLKQFEDQFRNAIETASPSIACIVVSRSEHYPKTTNPGNISGKLGDFDPKETLKSDSSKERIKLMASLDLANPKLAIPSHGYVGGVVVDSSGLILTPYHAIDGATKIYVYLAGKTGAPVGSYADIHAADARSDLAVLKLIHPPPDLKAITFAEVRTYTKGDLRPTMFTGKIVCLLSNAYATGLVFDAHPSAYLGTISSVRYREKKPENESREAQPRESFYKYGLLIEHDMKTRDSVTGSVLVDMNGHMVGLTVATAVIYNRELGPGYSIPTDEYVRRVIEVLKKGEEVEYGFMGINFGQADDLRNNPPQISGVIQHSPAFKAGLNSEVNSIVTKVNDIPIKLYDDLLLYTGNSLAGSQLKLTVMQGSEHKDYFLTLGKFKHDQPFIASNRPEPVFGLRVDYLTVFLQRQTREPQFARNFQFSGVCVRELVPDSPAANKFKALGDIGNDWIITHVNGTAINNPNDFYKASKGHATVKLTLRDWNQGNRQELTLP
jgi:serine protease Do